MRFVPRCRSTALLLLLLSQQLGLPPAFGQISVNGKTKDVAELANLIEDCRLKSALLNNLVLDIEKSFGTSTSDPTATEYVLFAERATAHRPAGQAVQRWRPPIADRASWSPTLRIETLLERSGYAFDLRDLAVFPTAIPGESGAQLSGNAPRWAITRCQTVGHELAELQDAYENDFSYSRNHRVGVSFENSMRRELGQVGLRGAEGFLEHDSEDHTDVVIPVGQHAVTLHLDPRGRDIKSIGYD